MFFRVGVNPRPLSPDYRGEGSEEIVLGVSTRPLAPAGDEW